MAITKNEVAVQLAKLRVRETALSEQANVYRKAMAFGWAPFTMLAFFATTVLLASVEQGNTPPILFWSLTIITGAAIAGAVVMYAIVFNVRSRILVQLDDVKVEIATLESEDSSDV